MFSNLFFLILVLLLINIVPEITPYEGIKSPFLAAFASIASYIYLLSLICFQNYICRKSIKLYHNVLLVLANVELIGFLALHHFIFAGHRLFAFSQIMVSLISLALYFGGLWVFHYSYGKIAKLFHPSAYAWNKLRFLAPFAIPFIILTILLEGMQMLPIESVQKALSYGNESSWGALIALLMSFFFLISMLVFLPPIIQWIWKCEDLKDSALKDQLEALCRKAQFTHAGFKTWTVLNDSLTAAIIGIIPRFRYIMFTKRVLQELSPEATQAILVHEIGHSYRKHLLIYPAILFGVVILYSLFVQVFSEPFHRFIVLNRIISPSFPWEFFEILFLFVPYAAILVIYFRLVFGYFSRIFERQADLHIFTVGEPPQHMIEALDHIAIATGNSHRIPSWHHYSIQERIDCLKNSIADPALIPKHHQKVRRSVILYFCFLALGILCFLAPLFPDVQPFTKIHVFFQAISDKIDQNINSTSRLQAAKTLMDRYHVQGNQSLISAALEKGLMHPGVGDVDGIAEYYAAELLLEQNQFNSAGELLAITWDVFTMEAATPQTIELLTLLTDQIFSHKELDSSVKQHLFDSYQKGLEAFQLFYQKKHEN